jgi:hypothetical protein
MDHFRLLPIKSRAKTQQNNASNLDDGNLLDANEVREPIITDASKAHQ